MHGQNLPEHFVVLSRVAPHLQIDLKYCTSDNLIGRPLAGYAPDGTAVMTLPAAKALGELAMHLQSTPLKLQLNMVEPTLIIWDTYRPEMACEDFWQWSISDCEKTKQAYYPNVNKRDMFKLGYIARKSTHCRGSTVDLNIIDKANGRMLDMGTRFDFMDVLSHPDNRDVSEEAFANRNFLKKLMNDFGFEGIDQEWWHFTFRDEPYPDTYFNFPVINFKE